MKKITSILILITIFGCKNIPSTSNSSIKNKAIEKQSISQKLKENIQLPIEQQIALYKKLKKEKPTHYNFENEDELTMYGYSFLWNNQTKEALEVFKLIAEQFPNSSNAYDSLGEAYLALGNKELSLFNYRKSLKMNPDNFNAEDQIERIENPNKKSITPKEKFAQKFSVAQYKADLDQLGEKLLKVHPNALKFISKDNFLQLIENKKKLITKQTTYGHFIWHCSEIIASINCSHTSLGGFGQESAMLEKSLIFPLQTLWVDNKLFVIDAMSNADIIKVKDEIIEINNQPVTKIISEAYKHIQSQGYVKTAKKHFFNAWSTEIIPYTLDFPKSYTIKLRENEKLITLKKAEKFIAPYTNTSIKKCKNNLCLDFKDNNKTAILTISSFNYYPWNNLNVFESFLKSSFKEINEKNSKNLIIDLRFNGGGSAESSIHLLKYLTNKSFTYFSDNKHHPNNEIKNPFKGNLYFIIDGHGESTTGHFMSRVKDLKLGTIVGEELGSNHFCTAGQTILRLKNTKLVYYVANTTSKTITKSTSDETGILPDFYVTQSINDYLNNTDTFKKYTLNLINHEK